MLSVAKILRYHNEHAPPFWLLWWHNGDALKIPVQYFHLLVHSFRWWLAETLIICGWWMEDVTIQCCFVSKMKMKRNINRCSMFKVLGCLCSSLIYSKCAKSDYQSWYLERKTTLVLLKWSVLDVLVFFRLCFTLNRGKHTQGMLANFQGRMHENHKAADVPHIHWKWFTGPCHLCRKVELH